MGRQVFLCLPPVGGPCPKCGRETEKDYTGARYCMEDVGGCGWSDCDDPE